MKQNLSRMALVLAVLVSFGQTLLVSGQHGGHGGGGGMSMPMPTQESVKTGKYTGEVVSVNPSSITVEGNKKGQTEIVTLLTTDQTKTKGEVTVGAEVKVKYREQGAHKLATHVEVKKPKGA